MNPYEFFVYYLMQPIALGLGLVGNLIGLSIFRRKKMEKIGPVRMYQILFLTDTFFILQSIESFLNNTFEIGLTKTLGLTCKIFIFVNYASYILSPMALFYISLEKFVSIKYPGKRFLLNKKKYQVIFILRDYKII